MLDQHPDYDNDRCKRLIMSSIMCKSREPILTWCKKYDMLKDPNTFSSGWLYNHAKKTKYNVGSIAKFTFYEYSESMNKINH